MRDAYITRLSHLADAKSQATKCLQYSPFYRHEGLEHKLSDTGPGMVESVLARVYASLHMYLLAAYTVPLTRIKVYVVEGLPTHLPT